MECGLQCLHSSPTLKTSGFPATRQMKVVITSGGTCEALDSVRVLTNISTGKLGAKIAEHFLGHEVFYVAPERAVHPILPDPKSEYSIHKSILANYRAIPATNVASVMEAMKNLVPEAHIVIQAMAISDFTFDLSVPVKISSKGVDGIIEHFAKTIRPNPKVISFYRGWNPNAVLVGFKFTVGETKENLKSIAMKMMADNRLDFVFANDKEMMKAAQAHVGFLLDKDGNEFPVENKDMAANVIYAQTFSLAYKRIWGGAFAV